MEASHREFSAADEKITSETSAAYAAFSDDVVYCAIY